MGTVNHLSSNQMDALVPPVAADFVLAERTTPRPKLLVGAYAALLLFMFVYCARPEDWIPDLSSVPLAKMTGILALLALFFSLQHIRQRFPREVLYLALLIGQLFLASALSPVWRGGAVMTTLDFAKVLIVVVVMAVAVNTSKRFRRLIFIHAVSVAAIAVVVIWKGRLIAGRLEGVLGGNYSNPNDLAVSIVISLPLCLALLFLTKNMVWKAAWAAGMLAMVYAVFSTGSRGGFLSLVVMSAVCLWEFAIRGRRRYLLVLAAFVGVILWLSSSGIMGGRLKGTLDQDNDTASAYDSAQQRKDLFWRSIHVTEEHPLFGIGPGNFPVVSGSWHVTHNSFTEMSSEGGVPAFFLYLLILWSGFRNLMMIKRLGRGQVDTILLARALQASIAGYIVGSLFASAAYEFFPYFLVAYTTALLWVAKKSAVRSKSQDVARQTISGVNSYGARTQPEISWESS